MSRRLYESTTVLFGSCLPRIWTGRTGILCPILRPSKKTSLYVILPLVFSLLFHLYVCSPLLSYYPGFLSFWLYLHYFQLFFLSFMCVIHFHNFVPFIIYIVSLLSFFFSLWLCVSQLYSHCPFVTEVDIYLLYMTTNNAYVNFRVSVLFPLFLAMRSVTARGPKLTRIGCEKRFPKCVPRRRGLRCAVSRRSIIKSWLQCFTSFALVNYLAAAPSQCNRCAIPSSRRCMNTALADSQREECFWSICCTPQRERNSLWI
jgi:hypothetical protein